MSFDDVVGILHLLAMVMLGAAGLLALRRMAAGPTSLDRSIAADVMVAIVIAGVGLYTIHYRNDVGLPVLLVLSLLGFTSAVGMARLISNRSDQIRLVHELRHSEEAPVVDPGPDAWEEDKNDGERG